MLGYYSVFNRRIKFNASITNAIVKINDAICLGLRRSMRENVAARARRAVHTADGKKKCFD